MNGIPKVLLPACMLLVMFNCGDTTTGTDVEETEAGLQLPVMVSVPGGTFSMGSVNGASDEQPVHTVTVSSFYMGATEVTQDDFNNLMSRSHPDYLSPSWWGETYGLGTEYPAYAVEWDEAVLYCNARSLYEGLDTVYAYTGITGTPGNACKLNGLETDFTKNGYRLPTEAEWEYACRGGSTTDFYWGRNNSGYPVTASDSAELSAYAVWSATAWDFGPDSSDFGTHQVATREPNAFGLYDMSGNVYEWVHDLYSPYSDSLQINPVAWDLNGYHFVRGGSWGNHAQYLTSSNRAFVSAGYIGYFYGFRTVRNDM